MPSTAPRPVDDAYPVLKQWTYIAHDRSLALDDALTEFLRARSALNKRRLATPRSEWTSAHTDEDRAYETSIYRGQGASYFLLSASSQVVRILDASTALGDLPFGVHPLIQDARNVLEHWDEWTIEKRSAQRVRAMDPDVWPFGLRFTNENFLVGGLVPLIELQDALKALWLWLSSAPPERIYPPANGPSYPYPLIECQT